MNLTAINKKIEVLRKKQRAGKPLTDKQYNWLISANIRAIVCAAK